MSSALSAMLLTSRRVSSLGRKQLRVARVNGGLVRERRKGRKRETAVRERGLKRGRKGGVAAAHHVVVSRCLPVPLASPPTEH